MALLSSGLGRGSERVSAARFALLTRSQRPPNRWVFRSRPTFCDRLNPRREQLPDKPHAVRMQLHTHRSFKTHASLRAEPLRSSIGLNWSIISGLAALLLAVAYLGGADPTSTEAEDLESIYPALSNSTDSLRLLVLLPGYWFQSIRCQLVSTTFSANPQYEALSYAWGDDPKWAFRIISLNGADVKVGRNLFSALVHLRSSTQPRVLWIDALCINQSDTDEKNKQIPLMLFIYSRAQGVVVWLGTHFSLLDMDKLSPAEYVVQLEHARVQKERQEREKRFDDIRKQLEELNKSKSKEQHKRYQAHDAVYDSSSAYKGTTTSRPPDWDGDVMPFLGALVGEGYWKRTWIVQEFIIASKLTILFGHSYQPWGNSFVPWDDFLKWVTYYNQVAPGDAGVQFILNLDRMRRSQFRDASEFTLASLVDTFQGSLCQLPHDKLYAFRGLAHDHVEGNLPVDYRKPPFEVYKDAIHFQNAASVRDGVERATEMVHFSALIYRLLTRDSRSAWQDHLKPSDSAQGSGVEELDRGLARSFPLKPEDEIALRGLAVRIKHIGPPLSELRASYTATRRWAASIADHVHDPNHLERARSLNSKLLMALAGHPDDMRPFVGDGGAVGLVSGNARNGDLVCQFWKHDTCVVLRESAAWRPKNGTNDRSYDVMGKSVLVSSVEHVDWEVTEDKRGFAQSGMGDGSCVLDLRVGLPGLMRLSLDVFGSRESAATMKTSVKAKL